MGRRVSRRTAHQCRRTRGGGAAAGDRRTGTLLSGTTPRPMGWRTHRDVLAPAGLHDLLPIARVLNMPDPGASPPVNGQVASPPSDTARSPPADQAPGSRGFGDGVQADRGRPGPRRAVNGPHLAALIRAGATFVDGRLVERAERPPPTRSRLERSSSTGMGYCSAPTGSPGRAAAPRRGSLSRVGAQADLSEDRLAPPSRRVGPSGECGTGASALWRPGLPGAGWVRYAVRGPRRR